MYMYMYVIIARMYYTVPIHGEVHVHTVYALWVFSKNTHSLYDKREERMRNMFTTHFF